MEIKGFNSNTNLLKKQTEGIKSTMAKIKQVSANVRHRGVERVNKVACFEVEIKHTNEYLIDLGSEYKAQVTAQQALKILQQRLQNYNERLAKSESAKQQAVKKNQKLQKVGKQNVVKLQDGKQGMLEVIGNENGEDIFNIVQFQPQSTPQQNYHPKIEDKNKQQKIVQQIVEQNNRVTQEDLEGDYQQLLEEADNDLDDDYQPQDGQEPDFMEQVRNRRVFGEEQKPQPKTNLATIVEQPKEEQKPLIAEKAIKEVKQPKESKQSKKPKQKKKVMIQKEKQEQKQPLPVKISKFKLQKMKEKLQKQIE